MSNYSKLDPGQIVRHVFDENLCAYKVVLHGTDFAVDLDRNDSITVFQGSISAKYTLAPNTTSEAFDISGMTKIALYAPDTASLEISPHSSDDVWYPLSVSTTPKDVLAKRARIKVAISAAAPATYYVVGSA